MQEGDRESLTVRELERQGIPDSAGGRERHHRGDGLGGLGLRAGHIARRKDNRWTKHCTVWLPRRGKRSRGRPSRWQDDKAKEETTWNRNATEDNGRN